MSLEFTLVDLAHPLLQLSTDFGYFCNEGKYFNFFLLSHNDGNPSVAISCFRFQDGIVFCF